MTRPIPTYYRNNVLKVARHEAGHMIAAKVGSFETGPITIEITDLKGGHRGGAEIKLPRSLRTIAETKRYLEDRVVVLWAGAIAEAFINVTADLEIRLTEACEFLNKGGATQDHAKARELVNLLRDLRFPETKTEAEQQAELTSIEKELWRRAIKVVEDEEALISEIAGLLANKVKVTNIKYILGTSEIAAIPGILSRFGP